MFWGVKRHGDFYFETAMMLVWSRDTNETGFWQEMRCGNKAWLCDLELDWSDAAEEGVKEK